MPLFLSSWKRFENLFVLIKCKNKQKKNKSRLIHEPGLNSVILYSVFQWRAWKISCRQWGHFSSSTNRGSSNSGILFFVSKERHYIWAEHTPMDPVQACCSLNIALFWAFQLHSNESTNSAKRNNPNSRSIYNATNWDAGS